MKKALLTSTVLFKVAFLVPFAPFTAFANPEGGQVVGGTAQIIENGKKLDIHQQTHRAAIDWRSFNIAPDEHTQFHQPSSSAIALNRVNDINPSRIAGQLSANGNIVLVNPNGVFFEGSSRVDVNGIVATTADIRTEDFMAGGNHFNIPGNPDAGIVNEGLITAREAGLVGLVAPHVENHGIIQAKLGRVQLASGDAVTVDFYGDDLLKVEVRDEETKSQLVANSGVLSANGGTVAMMAAAAEKTVNSLIVANGYIEAKSVGRDTSGAIIIGGEGSNKSEKIGNSYVAVSGTLDASGRNAREQGGRIEILGDHIALTQTAILDTSGFEAPVPNRKPNTGTATMTADKTINNGVRLEADFLAQDSRAGGSIKIGGDYLGKGDTQTAKTVKVADGALILNNAVENGDGGRTIIWSDDTTEFAGLVLSTGGVNGGHGGFVETSGKINLKADGFADLSAQDGFSKGTYLLDPQNIAIYGETTGSYGPTPGSYTATGGVINGVDLNSNLQMWLDPTDAATLTVQYEFAGFIGDATGTTGSMSVNTSNDLSTGALLPGAMVQIGADFYIVDSITPTTVTFTTPLINDYTNQAIGRGKVAQWTDKTLQGRNATSSALVQAPFLLKGVGPNGNDVLFFDGGNDWMDLPDFLNANQSTIIAGANFTENTGSRYLIGTDFTGGGRRFYLGTEDGDSLFRVGNGAAVEGNNIGLGVAVLSGTNDATEFSFFENGQFIGTNPDATVGAHPRLNLGSFNEGDSAFFGGEMYDMFIYDRELSNAELHLVEQYQATKWDVTLDRLAGAGNEWDEVTAHDAGDPTNASTNGFNAFSTRYLERLATNADIILRASDSVTLDLQGDTLDFTGGGAAGKSLTLQTDNGDITDASAGTIRTTRTGSGATLDGNINIIAGGAGNIDLNTTNLEALAGGLVNLTSGGTTNIVQTSTLTLGTVNSNGALALASSGGSVTSTGAITSTTGQVDIDAGALINAGSTITSGANGILLDAVTGINVSDAIDANGASAVVTATNTTLGNITFGSTVNLEDGFNITNNGASGNINITGAVLTNGGNSSLIAPNGTITTGAQVRNLSQDNITIDALNDAVNPTIFLGGNLINFFGSGEIDIRDNMRLNSGARLYTGTLSLESVDVNGFNLRLEPNTVLNLNGDISSNGGGVINFMTANASNTMNIGGSGAGFDYTSAIMGNIDLDSFATVNIGLSTGDGSNTTGTINLLSDINADATINVNTDGVFDLGANLETSNNQNILFRTDSGINVSSAANINTGTGDITITTDGANEVTTNDQLTVTTDNLTVNDNFNGDLTWRVTGTAPTASVVASAGSNLAIEQDTASDSMDIGSTTGSGTIGLSTALITDLDTNFDDLTFGRSDGGAVNNYATSFSENVSVLSNTTFTNEAALNMGGNILNVQTTSDITLNQDISSTSATANAIILSTGDDFINNAGNDALTATNSNWIVYSDDPVGNQNNGLLPDESFYNQGNLAAVIASKSLATNNVYGYATATRPTLTFDVDDLNVEYGEVLGALSSTYNAGLVGDDTLGTIGQLGSATLGTSYVVGTNANTYAGDLTGAIGSLTNVLGYQYAFNAGTLTVDKADLNVSVNPASADINQGDANPSFNLSYGPFKLADTDADLDILPNITPPALNSVAGSYPVTLAGGSDNNYNYVFTDGVLNILAVSPPPAQPTPPSPPVEGNSSTGGNNTPNIPSSVERDFAGQSFLDNIDNNNFTTTASAVRNSTQTEVANSKTIRGNIVTQALSLPGSEIDIEIEGLGDNEPEQTETGPSNRRVMKLRISEDLANELNLEIEDNVLID